MKRNDAIKAATGYAIDELFLGPARRDRASESDSGRRRRTTLAGVRGRLAVVGGGLAAREDDCLADVTRPMATGLFGESAGKHDGAVARDKRRVLDQEDDHFPYRAASKRGRFCALIVAGTSAFLLLTSGCALTERSTVGNVRSIESGVAKVQRGYAAPSDFLRLGGVLRDLWNDMGGAGAAGRLPTR